MLEADLVIFAVFTISMEQIQCKSSHNIRLPTGYDQRQYVISNNIKLSTIYDQRQYTIIYNIRSVTIINNYLHYKISDNIRLSTVYDQRQYIEMPTYRYFGRHFLAHLAKVNVSFGHHLAFVVR